MMTMMMMTKTMMVMNLVALTAEKREGNEYKVWPGGTKYYLRLTMIMMMIFDDNAQP